MAKTSRATRNVRKFIKRQTTGVKGRMVTDDYGNKLSVKKKSDGSFGRRHTLSRGKERAHALTGDKKESKDFHDNLKKSRKYDKVGNTRITTRHTLSAKRRNTLNGSLHDRVTAHKNSSRYAASIHSSKRKSKDFTK